MFQVFYLLNLNINIHIKLELFYLFFDRRPAHKSCFLSCKPFIVNATFLTGLVVFSVSWFVQLTVPTGQETEETTRPVENVALTMKGLQERKHNL